MAQKTDELFVRELEEIALNAWPALKVMVRDGWLLRQAAGYTKRANAVHMPYAGQQPFAEKIAWAEAVYRRAGQPAIFRLTPLAPDGIDEALFERGYDRVEPSLVQVTDIAPSWRHHDVVILSDLPDSSWTRAYGAAAQLSIGQSAALAAMLTVVAPRATLARIEQDGSPVAFGMAVVERGYVGFFDMMTLPNARRHGFGRMIMESLFAWARGEGATQGTLQVVKTNKPARALYASFGFRPVYGYHYRVGSTA